MSMLRLSTISRRALHTVSVAARHSTSRRRLTRSFFALSLSQTRTACAEGGFDFVNGTHPKKPPHFHGTFRGLRRLGRMRSLSKIVPCSVNAYQILPV